MDSPLERLSKLFQVGIDALRHIKVVLDKEKTYFNDVCLDETKGVLSFWYVGVRLYFDTGLGFTDKDVKNICPGD